MLDTFSMAKEISVLEQRYRAVLLVIWDSVRKTCCVLCFMKKFEHEQRFFVPEEMV
jgi:hypothetical protein